MKPVRETRRVDSVYTKTIFLSWEIISQRLVIKFENLLTKREVLYLSYMSSI